MVFGGEQGPRVASPHNGPLVAQMKVANAIVQRILINTRSSVDIITWDCLKKLTYPRRDIVPLVHPILGFRGQEVNPTGMIRLLLHFGDKGKAKNVEIDFLVVDIPTAYNIILGQPTLHKVKAPTCFSFNLKPTMDVWARCRETSAQLESVTYIRPLVSPTAAEALVIHILASAEPDRPRPEAVESVEQV
ncbi:LOW QUALITY PROTEIN: hypothetical protein Cgig2_015858 [Carnegiea gigantea]|uniref:Uncharacterized protein n=1 Tax=Carnegiea gigantea TaxID=171969 RepID=A0A9Q1GTS7_9CARY|nr:LOW QUALITY PROTEIN: hypothetical protein Cgig2_015858 [Carnegiea gigantea]